MRRVLAAGVFLTMACGPGESPPPNVKDVSVSASATTLVVGATTQLTAHVTGADGQPVEHPIVTWSSVTPAVVSVSAGGIVTALQAGQGTVRASSGGRSGEISLTITSPPVATATFDRDSVVLTLPGGSVTPTLTANDAAGRVIPNATFFFSSDAPKVATVSQLGVITAVAAGTAVISASNEGVTASIRVRVTATVTATSPRITAVTPLVAGGAAVVTGSNFAATIGGNAVLVEGVPATVSAATTTQLNITLPASGWTCDNVRPVTLQVNANNETGVATANLRTAVQRTLAVGQSLVLSTASEARCNELSVTGGSYLVTVYNVARAVSGGEASFALRGAAVTSAQADVVAISRASVARGARTPASTAHTTVGGVAPQHRILADYARIGSSHFARWQEIAREQRSEATHADVMQRSLAFARSAGSPAAAWRRQRAATEGAVLASGALANQISSTLGAINPLKIPNLDAQNFCADYIRIGARTAWVGPHAIIVEDTTSVLNGTPTLKGQLDSLYALVGQEFETVMWPILTQNFGNPLAMDPNLSKTGKLVMFFSPRINTMASGMVTGFVVSCDFYLPSQAPSSNYGEYFYAISPTSLASGISSGTRDAWMRQIRATIIHEVKHITSFGERFSRNAEFEELWLEEGLARHAEEQYARSIYGTAWKANTGYQASVFCDVRPANAQAPQCAGRPILMLRHFDALYQYLQSPEPYTVLGRVGAGDATFYGTAWSVARWMMDHYATSEAAFLSGLVQSTKSGVANLEARVTGPVWEQMFGEWALALYTDDYPGVTFANARLQFPSWNLRDQFLGLCNDFGPCVNPLNPGTVYPVAYPFAPRPVSFGAFSTTIGALNAGSFSSWLMSGTQATPQLLDLRGANGGEPPGQLRLAIVRVQ
ncbi:MAG: Ig-like domain-containing protein [Gemmatimonadaceae bacterium]